MVVVVVVVVVFRYISYSFLLLSLLLLFLLLNLRQYFPKFRNMIYGLPLKGEVKPRVMEYAIAAMVSPGTVARDAITGVIRLLSLVWRFLRLFAALPLSVSHL